MGYKEELEQPEWKEKRKVILERDNHQCAKCKIKRSEFLGISHKFGILNYNELIKRGYSFKRTGNLSEKIELAENDFPRHCNFISSNLKEIPLNKLNIALQFKEARSVLAFAKYELICFNEDDHDDDKFFDLNIHHKYYQKGKKAWEYENEALITLCSMCHKVEHGTNKTPILDEKGRHIGFSIKCDRCDGSGVLLEYKHYKNGICFECNGRGDI
jgi:5-methylcytosine-specific restriction endonuclease McrA